MRKLKKYRLVAQTSLQNSLAYASNFFVDLFFYAFILLYARGVKKLNVNGG